MQLHSLPFYTAQKSEQHTPVQVTHLELTVLFEQS